MNNKLAVVASLSALTISLASPILIHQEARARYTQAGQDHAALCAFEHNLHEQVVSSTQFLIQHPNGIPGIPAKLIKQGLATQRHTLRDFNAHIKC